MESEKRGNRPEWSHPATPPPEYSIAPPQVDEEGGLGNVEGQIPYVDPLNVHWHLSILRRFCALYEIVENLAPGGSEQHKAQNVQLFLVCAEARYLSYLLLVEEVLKEHRGSRTLPLPPWDVAIIFHAHCLSPFRYLSDMLCRGLLPLLWTSDMVFPLKGLHHMIFNGIWSDPESERQWKRAYPNSPYQLWTSDPTKNPDAVLRLLNLEMVCPWCEQIETYDLVKFTLMRTRKAPVCQCPSCGMTFNAENLSAQNLKKDLNQFLSSKQGWHVKGVSLDSDGNQQRFEAEKDLSIVLEDGLIKFPTVIYGKSSVVGTSLTNYIRNPTQDASWVGFRRAFNDTLSELKSAQKFKDINNRNIFPRLRMAYMGVIWRDLSIDLVAASLRQREFAKKITSGECNTLDSPFELSRAISRYYKFMNLLKEENPPVPQKCRHLVPTLDIDLCWHTHQLSLRYYHEWCSENLGRVINHDDTIKKTHLEDGLRITSLAWLEAYQEPYTTDDLKKAYLTPTRKVAGVLFPPYGLHVLHKGKKLAQATRGDIAEDKTDHAARDHYHETVHRNIPMSMYPYWTIYPFGWNYPAACASNGQGNGGWGAGVCGSANESSNAEGASCASGQCGGGTSACANSSGNCGSGGCGSGGGGSGGACGGGGCGC